MNRNNLFLLTTFYLCGPANSQEIYRIVEISTPAPYTASAASDINDNGLVAGTVIDAQGITHAVRWNRTSPPEILPLPAKYTNSFAVAIDGRGAVSGSATKKGRAVGMSWRLASDLGQPAATNLAPVPLRSFSVVLDIESRPTRKGFFRRRDPSDFAGYRLKRKMRSRAIHVVNNRKRDYGAGVATSVNEGGVVAGYLSKESAKPANGLGGSAKFIVDPIEAFARNKKRNIMPLPEMTERAGIFAINNATTMVGQAVIGQDNRAARWKVIDNNNLNVESLAGLASAGDVALAANGLGVVVGRSVDANGQSRAVRWMSDGSVADLNTMIPGNTKWELLEARGVNRDGFIVGIGRKDGKTRGFAMQPALDDCLITGNAVQGGTNEIRTGETIVYEISYSNACNRTLEDVVVRQKLPAGTDDLRCLTMKVDENPTTGEISGRLGTLPPGASGTISFSMRVIAAPGSMITNKLVAVDGRSIMTLSPPPLVTPVADHDTPDSTP